MTDRAAHVGYHLVGDGRRDLEADIGYRPRASRRLRRVVRSSPTVFYAGSVGLITALLIGLGMAYFRGEGGMPGSQFWVALLLLVPATEVAVILVQRIVATLVRPQRLLRLELKDGLPPQARTMAWALMGRMPCVSRKDRSDPGAKWRSPEPMPPPRFSSGIDKWMFSRKFVVVAVRLRESLRRA